MKENEEACDLGQVKQEGEATYKELPGLLFSNIGSNRVFNAEHFIESLGEAGKGLTVQGYLEEREKQIDFVCERLEIDKKHIHLKLEGQPSMISAILGFDFACWAVPSLLFYSYERLHEVFINGFTVSDRYLSEASDARLPKQEDVNQA